MLCEFYWEGWVGEKKRRASKAAGVSSGGGQKRIFNGHMLCAPLAQRPHSIVGAESLPSDHKMDLERVVCVSRGLIRNKGLLENIQHA